jgi:protocatechuate 3,4-dioxygenase beta subunit
MVTKYILLSSILALSILICHQGATDTMAACNPTPQDALGPFYKPNAPMRSSVGQGYVLTGTVRSSKDCSPIEGARIEFWLAAPNGRYDDDRRATLLSGKSGLYRFESSFPPPYSGRPSHVHIRVSAQGYKTIVTQHYPAQGQTEGKSDLVLIPSE